MTAKSGGDVGKMRRLMLFQLLCVGFLLTPLATLATQVDPSIRDRLLPAAVQIAIMVRQTVNGNNSSVYYPVGSGTIIDPHGLILTNYHVVDMSAHQVQLQEWEDDAARRGEDLALELDEGKLLILGSENGRPPEPLFIAQTIELDPSLDFAILQIISDAVSNPLEASNLSVPFVPLGDSDSVALGEPIDIFSYPLAGGDSLTYTTGVVSGFNFEDGTESPVWITTDATISGGSSGGTAVNRNGELVGVPTQGSSLDCRPGDTNFDGTVDSSDPGCIPIGGSIGQLRPINLVLPMFERATANILFPSESPRGEVVNVPDAPTQTKPSLRWSLELGDLAGILAIDDGVISTSGFLSDTINAIDAHSGQHIWSTRFEDIVNDAATEEGNLYVGTGQGIIHALEAASGTEKWQYRGGESAQSVMTSSNGILALFSSEPPINWSDAIDNSGDVLAMLDSSSGQRLWDFYTEGSISIAAVAHDVVVLKEVTQQTDDDGTYGTYGAAFQGKVEIVALNLQTGQLEWSFTTKSGAEAMTSDGVRVYIFSADTSEDNSTQVDARDALTGQTLWQSRFDLNPYFATHLMDDNSIYLANLQSRDCGSFTDYAPENCSQTLYSVDRDSGKQQWAVELEGVRSGLVVTDEGVFFVGNHALYVVDKATGQLTQSTSLKDGKGPTTLASAAGTLFVVIDQTLSAMNLD